MSGILFFIFASCHPLIIAIKLTNLTHRNMYETKGKHNNIGIRDMIKRFIANVDLFGDGDISKF